MIKEPNMLVEQPHSLGAMMKGAILLIFFVFGVATYAQSYNAPISYRISGTTQSTASAEQRNGGVANGVGSRVSESGYRMSDNTYLVPNQAYRAFDDGYQVSNVTYKAYQGAVYEPFNDTPPSEAGGKGISGRKNAFPGRPDTGQSSDSPVGEPWVLLLFAAAAAVWIGVRNKEPRTKTNQ